MNPAISDFLPLDLTALDGQADGFPDMIPAPWNALDRVL
jgi:hypothetical protein